MNQKLIDRKAAVRQQIRKALKDAKIGNKRVETRELIEEAIERASLYKYDKVMLLTEIIGKIN